MIAARDWREVACAWCAARYVVERPRVGLCVRCPGSGCRRAAVVVDVEPQCYVRTRVD